MNLKTVKYNKAHAWKLDKKKFQFQHTFSSEIPLIKQLNIKHNVNKIL